MKFLDISGFGHSGKSVVTDLLSEFEGYNVPHYNFEFNLLRIQGGLIDLKHAMIDNWSPVRSDAALRRFKRLVRRIGPKASVSSPSSMFYSNGMNYDEMFQGQFSELSYEYMSSLIQSSFLSEWPYQMIDDNPLKQFAQRLQVQFRLKRQFLTQVHLTSIDEETFVHRTNTYLRDLFGLIGAKSDRVMVTHNALEPFNPTTGLTLLPDSKLITVQRDPRDIYASVMASGGYTPGYETNRHWRMKVAMLGMDDIQTFCDRQLTYYNQIKSSKTNNVLMLRYEDVVLNYEEALNNIYEFLGEDSSVHSKKGKVFKPELSKKNIGLWRDMPDNKNIEVIQEMMPNYLFHS